MDGFPYGRAMTYEPLLELAESVVAEGFNLHEAAVEALTTEARRRGVKEVLLGIVSDRTAPRVVRERALGLVIVAIDQRGLCRTGEPPRLVSCPNDGAIDHLVDVGAGLEPACA